jgi:beta-1,4-mannooligosaccharide/beta-1,4-mannosyl-N-acetylglucosamine phosphorylase
MYDGKTILLVSITYPGSPSHTYLAISDDGIRFDIAKEKFFQFEDRRFDEYLSRIIDTRITKIDDTYYIFFPVNYRPVGVQGPVQVNKPAAILCKTKDFKTVEPIEVAALPPNRVPCLFPEKIGGRYARLDRPGGGAESLGDMWVSYSPDLIYWGCHRAVLQPYAAWNSLKLGPTPPIKTDAGWLVVIHGVQRHPCAGNTYRLGAVLLDLEDPSKVIGKTRSWIFAPAEIYELYGEVNHVVFTCGCIADYEQDRLRVYYGAADTYIGLATCRLSELVQLCIDEG